MKHLQWILGASSFKACTLTLCLMLSCYHMNLQAQNTIRVKGKVLSEEKLGMVGVVVREEGSTNGVLTDIDGNYSIAVPKESKLEYSFIGMKTKIVAVDGRSEINITLAPSKVELDEVVAVGYGTARRGEITSAISSVSGKDLEKMPMTDALQALSGRVAGLQISQNSGAPGAESQVKIRGGISITQSNEPLYIIDGFPSPEGLSSIEPSDIESIDVMKDASATAIYGAAGANGVVLITTKSGKEGRTNINFDTYIGFKNISKRLNVLSVSDFVRLEYERAMLKSEDEKRTFVQTYGDGYNEALSVDDNMQNSWYDIPQYYNNRTGVDWQNEVFDSYTPVIQNYKLSIDGGSKETNFNVSYSHTNNDGIMQNSGFKRNNIRLKLSHKFSDRFTLDANATYLEDDIKGLGSLEDGGRFSSMRSILQSRPVSSRDGSDYDLLTATKDPIFKDDDGNVMINPLTAISEEERNRGNQMMVVYGSLRYEMLKGLTFRMQTSLRRRNTANDVFYHADSRQANRSGGPYARLYNNSDDSWSYTNTLTYIPRLPKKHRMNVLLGQEESYRKFNSFSMYVMGFDQVNNGLNSLEMGTNPTIPETTVEAERAISFFGRVNYTYLSKYIFSATYRMDGSSKFGKEHKWGYFPSASFAWRAAEEPFIKNLNTFSDLKVRLGVGAAGNNHIPRYMSQFRIKPSTMPENNQETNAAASVQLANPDLKWETDVSVNFGVEMGFFDQRLQVVMDVYKNTAKDLLLNRQIPLVTGYATVQQNIGATENQGLELALTAYIIDKKDFSWTSSLNFSSNRNQVKKLAQVNRMPVRSGWASGDYNDYDYLLEVGSALGQMWGWETDGIYTVDDFNFNETTQSYELKEGVVKSNDPNVKPGYWKYKNQNPNEDNIIDDKDKTIIGNANPKCYGGLTNAFQYKNFDCSFMLNYSIGGKVYNANKMFFTKMDYQHNNALTDVNNHFTYINSSGEDAYNNPQELALINENAAWASVEGSSSSTIRLHSKFVEDASFLRLANIMLGYSLPKNLLNRYYIQKMRVYASANNLFTLTKYSGFDPEVNTRPNGGLTPGIDWGAYPRAFTILFGLNVTF